MINILKKTCILFVFVFLFSCTVYASDSINYYENIYSIDQYTTVRQLIDDSHFKPSTDQINDFLANKTYSRKYIISFCNSSRCEEDKNSRSIALLGFGDDIDADFVLDNSKLTMNLTGPDDAKLYFYHNTGALPVNGTFALSLFNSSKYTTFYNFRGILPCYNVSNVDSLLPSMLFDKIFNDFQKKMHDFIINNLGTLIPVALIIFFIPIFAWSFKRLRRSFK